MRILATDLDRTLLPNGSWPSDPGAIPMFNELTVAHDVFVVYVTGRNLALTEAAIADFGIRHPHALIGDVGTSIRTWGDDVWTPDPGWDGHVARTSPAWDADAIRGALAGVDGLVEQAREHCGPFKQSYYVEHDDRERVLSIVHDAVENRYDEAIVYSFDSQSGDGLLDLLPRSANKQTALEYLAEAHGIDNADVVFCGDSGNDLHPLTAGFSGVLVRNADEQLVSGVNRALDLDPELKVYFAQGGCRGLNGYYTGGVIEGAFHYGLFAD
ncbi:MAG: HAD-IIB family hydrolase [Gammaproteobacteria bacterium]|nr:HAD-IIB family hydrolase [Gammaproteobacteria bacterium]